MKEKIRFRAVIESADRGGAFVKIPFDVEKIFCKKRVKIIANIEGEIYRGSLVRMGTSCHILGILKEIREKIARSIGDEIEIELQEDTDPRIVEMPSDLKIAFAGYHISEDSFCRLSYTKQKEYLSWITSAKKEITRQKRIEAVCLYLQSKK
jgi:hypothetical protein